MSEETMHPFWQGWHDRECGADLDYSKHPAWIHGWECADEYLFAQADRSPKGGDPAGAPSSDEGENHG